MKKLVIICGLFLSAHTYTSQVLPKVNTTKTGLLIGIQKGKFDGFEIGFERQWKQVKLIKPRTVGLSVTGEYLFKANGFGIKAGPWVKPGRTSFTYGANLLAATKFNQPALGFAPSVGFKLLGFHGQVSYNFIKNGEEFDYNKLNVSLRYFISRKRKFTVDRQKDGQKWF